MDAKKIAWNFDNVSGYEDEAIKFIQETREKHQLSQLIDEFIPLLKEGTTNDQVGAIHALHYIEEARDNPEIIKILIELLPDTAMRDYQYGGFYADEDDMTTPGEAAAGILGRWRVSEAVDVMMKVCSNKNLWAWNRIACIRALTSIGELRAILVLEPITQEEQDYTSGVYSQNRQINIGVLAKTAISEILQGNNTPVRKS